MKELQNIIRAAEANAGRAAVLATLVKTEGSSYRRVGARLYWRPDAPRIGSISGGCLEEDLLLKAEQVLRTGRSQVVIYDTTDENDLVWGVGLGCHGIVRLTLERVSGLPIHFAEIERLWSARQPAVLATAFGGEASSIAQAVALFSEAGTVFADSAFLDGFEPEGGASIEAVAQRTLETHTHQFLIGSRGEPAHVLLEYLPPPFCLNVFGAGDDAQPLCRLARELGWIVRIFDPRPAHATRERFPDAQDVQVLRVADAIDDSGALPEPREAAMPLDRWSAAVVMTHHYRYDVPLLSRALRSRAPYVGLLGPKKRAEKILEELERGDVAIDEEMRRRLHAPVGLDLGSTSPEQVALSIVAEIEASLNHRDGRPLRERTRPIHG